MKKLMLGNAAVAQGAYEAGVHLVSSYPGTPSTEITECMATYPAEDVFVEWAPNEKVAAEVVVGAAIAGGRAMSCCKHVGLNVMADPVFTVSYTGVNGPVEYSVYVNALASEQNLTLKGMGVFEFANDITISVLPHGQDTAIECQYNLATYAHGLEDNAFAVALYNYAKTAAAYQSGVQNVPVN